MGGPELDRKLLENAEWRRVRPGLAWLLNPHLCVTSCPGKSISVVNSFMSEKLSYLALHSYLYMI